jgi:two-component system cell cycle sensor histidine kinase/response regulator CckA
MPNETDPPGVDSTTPPASSAILADPTTDEFRVFKALADSAFFANVIADPAGNFRYVNRYFARLCGYAPEEMIGRSIALVHTPEQLAISRRIMETAARDGVSTPQEHWYLHRDGTEFPLVVGCVTVRFEEGGGTYTAMSAIDPAPVHDAEGAYQTLFTEMLDGFAHHRIICDDAGAPVDYRFLAVNPAFERMTGLEAADIVGRTVMEVMPGTEQRWIDTYGAVALTGKPTRFEQYAGALDKYFEVTAFSPAPGEFATIFQDTTEAMRARAQLRATADELQRTQRLAKTGSWTWDFATDEVRWSEELFGVFGIEPALIAPSFSEQEALITPETYKALNEAVARTSETGIPYEVELEIPREDGTSRWLWARGEPLSGPDGGRMGLWGAAQDITERKRGEEALRKSEEDLRRTQRSVRLGTWSWDAATDAATWSEAMFDIYGLDSTPPAPTLTEQAALYTPASYKRLIEAVAEAMETGVPYELDIEFVRTDGEHGWLRAIAAPLVDPEGRRTGLWGSVQDISERRRDEDQRLHLEAQLARAQRLESVGRLAGSVAHDFNNMLTVILGHAERALAEAPPEDPLRTDLQAIRQAADRAADLTRQLLAFARSQPASPAVIDLNPTVAGVLTMLTRLIGEGIELAWRPGEGLAPVRIDPTQVGQILTNLCINARDAITDSGRIVVATGHASFDEAFCDRNPDYRPGDYVQLAVSDNGSGMDAETLTHIFDPFFTTKELERGTGLGLSTVYGIAQQNEGFVRASSEPGVGTTLSVYLPRQDASPDPMREEAPSRASQRGGATILLVEDESAILAMATRALEGQGFVILPAGTPTEALHIAAAHPGVIDLLLTDVIMPEMNGRVLADELRSTRPDLKVLFMSGYTSDVVTGHDTPGSDASFISKPFHLRALTETVREILDA